MHLTWQVALATDESTSGHDSDLEIVRRAQTELNAFAPLYEQYAPIIYHYCLRRLTNREAAADATSAVFVKAINALPRFRPDSKRAGSTFRSWLFAIAHNVVVDAHRQIARHARNWTGKHETGASIPARPGFIVMATVRRWE